MEGLFQDFNKETALWYSLNVLFVFLVGTLTLVRETHLEDSTVLKPPRSSASFLNLQLCFPGSCGPSTMGQVTWDWWTVLVCVCVHVSQFSVCLGGGGGFSEQVGKHCKCAWKLKDDPCETEEHYLLVCLWCWMTRFFSWMVSSRAVARDLRSEMDWGVAGRLQPCSSRSISWTKKERERRVGRGKIGVKQIKEREVGRE